MPKLALLALLLAVPALLPASPRLSAEEVAAWADDTFGRALSERRFSGLAITVVQDDAVLFERGYGYSDLARKLPIDPQRTGFRIGSITKTFTAMAIAQLLERGAIESIDDPVNQYLKRDQLPRIAGKDITLRHLLTHTAGFDSRAMGLGTEREFDLPLGADAIAAMRPPIVGEPGELSVYSNYGTAMLGAIVEDITGKVFGQYLEEAIFAPLQMRDTVLNTTARPSPGLAIPSRFLPSGATQPQRYFGVHPFYAPAGAIEATPADMARYMIANLQAGRGASAAVLGPEQFHELHRRTAGNHPASSGFGQVFITLDWSGVAFFGHGGDWPGFHSIMMMSPEANAGFFISCLCEHPQPGFLESLLGSPRMEPAAGPKVLEPMTNVGVTVAFLERFWGKRSWPRADFRSDPAKYVGTYWHEFRNHAGAEKFLELLGGDTATILVERDGESALRINGRGGYTEVSPGVFWNARNEAAIHENFWHSGLWAFSQDAAGVPRHASPTFAIDPYVRSSDWNNPRFAMSLLLICGLVSLTGLIAAFWPAGGAGAGRAGKWLPPAVAAALLAMVPTLLAGYPEGDGIGTALLLGERPRFLTLILLANGIALAALAMAIVSVLVWRRGAWGAGKRALARRVHFTLLALAALGLAWVFAFANLLGLRLP